MERLRAAGAKNVQLVEQDKGGVEITGLEITGHHVGGYKPVDPPKETP